MALTNHLRKYLEQTLGERVDLEPAVLSRLPVYLAHAYRPWRARIFGREFVLAESRSRDVPPRTRLAADLRTLRDAAAGCEVALILGHVDRGQRARLVSAGIPFIVP